MWVLLAIIFYFVHWNGQLFPYFTAIQLISIQFLRSQEALKHNSLIRGSEQISSSLLSFPLPRGGSALLVPVSYRLLMLYTKTFSAGEIEKRAAKGIE